MTTLNLGAIRLNWRGSWLVGDSYANRDCVAYNGESFIAINPSQGQAPKTAGVVNGGYWQLMAAGASQLTTKGDTLWHDGSQHARIPVGTAGNVMTVKANNVVGWSAPSGYEGSTFLVGTRPWLASPNLVGTGNEPWLGDPASDNMRIAAALPNPSLGARQWRAHAYHGSNRQMALNNKYEFVARGDGAYAVVGQQPSSNNKYSTTPMFDIMAENGLMKTGDFFVQIHQIGSSGAVIALTRLGDVWFKGYNGNGWAGNGHTTDCYGWVKVPYLGPDASVSNKACTIIGLHTTQVINGGAADNITIFAIDSSYRLWTWGYNGNGECGIGNTTSPQTTPQLVSAIPNCRMVSAGLYTVMAVDNTGQLYTWGYNTHGQLGTGNTTSYSSPQLIPGATNVYDIHTHCGSYYSAGWNYYYRTYFLKNNGELWGAGLNNNGELGLGHANQQNSYARCNPSLTFSDFTTTGSAVYCSVMALGGTPGNNNGMLYSWGYNGNGQLGNATTTTSYSAVRPDTLCDTSRNRTKSYVNGVMSDNARVFPRDNITKIASYGYGESSSGFFVWDNYNRMYIIGYGYNMATYRNDSSGISYSRPCLMPSMWSGESGNATPYSYDVIGIMTDTYEYSPSYMNVMQTTDGRIWWMGTANEGAGANDANFNGRWQQWGM